MCLYHDFTDLVEQITMVPPNAPFILGQNMRTCTTDYHSSPVDLKWTFTQSGLELYIVGLQWTLTYPDTFVPELTVCTTEFPDK